MTNSRMMKSGWAASATPLTKSIKQIVWAGALGLIALAVLPPGGARAQDSSGDSTLFGSVLKSLGIGGENNIEYRERPPLVVPPGRDLPPPQAPGTARNPNWPVDPKSADVQQKKGNQVRDLDRLPVPQRPAVPSVAVTSQPAAPGGAGTPASTPPSQPGLFDKLFSSNDMPATGAVIPVPTRKTLTQPPLDYEAPSAAQPYGTATPAAPAKATPESALQAGQTAPRPGGL
jgi:hypothetical protein